MPSFSTVPIVVGSKRGLRLEFRVNDQDRHPIRLNLVEDTPLKDSPGLPFSYEFVDTERGHARPRMRIVAGPGVFIFFDTSVATKDSVMIPSIEIIRVQDVDLVPPIGMQTVSSQFLRDYEYGESIQVYRGDRLFAPNFVRPGPLCLRVRRARNY